jgi:hypothetical protein
MGLDICGSKVAKRAEAVLDLNGNEGVVVGIHEHRRVIDCSKVRVTAPVFAAAMSVDKYTIEHVERVAVILTNPEKYRQVRRVGRGIDVEEQAIFISGPRVEAIDGRRPVRTRLRTQWRLLSGRCDLALVGRRGRLRSLPSQLADGRSRISDTA